MKKYILALVFLASCGSPQKGTVVDLITPDTFGVGVSEGTIDGYGLGNKTMRNQEEPLELDFEGESKSTSVWLEWDLPTFTDHEALDKDRRSDRYMVAINDKVTNLQELASYQMERDVEISDSHDVLVDAFLIDSDRKEQQLFAVSEKLSEVQETLEGLEGLVLYNTERLGEVENLIPEVEEVTVVVNYPPSESTAPPSEEESLTMPAVMAESTIASKINLEEAGRPYWLWALFLLGVAANLYIVYRVVTSKVEDPKYIPASEVKSSLEWLRKDLINDDSK